MATALRRAFKEWAVVCRALGEGRQILILRKGGIEEGPQGFRVTDQEFLLFPTHLHQSADGVIPAWREALAIPSAPESGRTMLTHLAQVSSWHVIRDLEKLQSLRNLHIWSDALISERFHRWSDESVFALLVRVYELGRPFPLDSMDRYGGCKSWITLEEDVPIDGLRPVLGDEEFERKIDQVKSTLH